MGAILKHFACVLLLLGSLGGCSSSDLPDEHYTLYVFGTLVEVVVPGSERAAAERIMPQISARFVEMHRDWHAWLPGEMTRLNAAFASGQPMKVSPMLKGAIRQAQLFEKESDGVFNPAIGKLIGLWGFHSDDLPVGPAPSPSAIDTLVAKHPSMADITLFGNMASSANPFVALDFGGFAKGAALDWAAQELAANGAPDAVLNAGGDVNVIGTHGDREWRVAIRDPKGWGAIASAALRPGETLYTSGNYFRYHEDRGVRYSHIIDPRTGYPVDEIVSASVITQGDGALADAAATALSVAGLDHWQEVARSMGLTDVLLVDQQGRIHLTSQMKARIRLEGDTKAGALMIEDLGMP